MVLRQVVAVEVSELSHDQALEMQKKLDGLSLSKELRGRFKSEDVLAKCDGFFKSFAKELSLDDAFKRAAKDDLLAGLNGIKEKVGPKLPPTVAADDWQSVASITEEDLSFASMSKLTAHAEALGEQEVVRQLQFLNQLQFLILPLAKCKSFLTANETRAAQTVKPAISAPIALVRSALPGVTTYLTKGGRRTMQPENEDGDFVEVLAGLTDADLQVLSDDAHRVVQTLTSQWASDVTEICAMINAWVPQGWQAKKDTLLDDREVNRS